MIPLLPNKVQKASISLFWLILASFSLNAATTNVNISSAAGTTNLIRGFIVGSVGDAKLLLVIGTNIIGISTNSFANTNILQFFPFNTNQFATNGTFFIRSGSTVTNMTNQGNFVSTVFNATLGATLPTVYIVTANINDVNATNSIKLNGVDVITNAVGYRSLLSETNTWSETNNFTGILSKNGINVLTNIPANGSVNALVIWLTTNSQSYIVNGVGMLTNDGSGHFGFTTNLSQDLIINNLTINSNLTVNSITINSNLTILNSTTTSNLFYVSGKGNTLIITNYIQYPWTTLTMSGSNVSTIDLTNSMFKLLLTNNAFINIPTSFPGTNVVQTFQVHFIQDGTGTRTVTLTNSAWVISGSGTSTNAVLSITTNANAVSVLTFVTSPFSATKVYGITTPF